MECFFIIGDISFSLFTPIKNWLPPTLYLINSGALSTFQEFTPSPSGKRNANKSIFGTQTPTLNGTQSSVWQLAMFSQKTAHQKSL